MSVVHAQYYNSRSRAHDFVYAPLRELESARVDGHAAFNFRLTFNNHFKDSLTRVESQSHERGQVLSEQRKAKRNDPKINCICVNVLRFLWNSPQQKINWHHTH